MVLFDVSLTVNRSTNLFLSPTLCTFALFCNICITLDEVSRANSEDASNVIHILQNKANVHQVGDKN
jgi:hypothetical protein